MPIFVSKSLKEATRVVIVLGETTQDLGVLAQRVASGPGGVNQGSLVSLVRGLQDQSCSAEDDSRPGIILANMGQRYWWPEGRRAITVGASDALPLPSLVHFGHRYSPSVNDIPSNETPDNHIKYMFGEVLPKLMHPDAKLDIIAIAESCELIQRYLDQSKNWACWGHRLNSMVMTETNVLAETINNASLLEFLRKVL
jgi:hypothetical protein